MTRYLVPALLAAVAGCAAPRAQQKMSFDEAFGSVAKAKDVEAPAPQKPRVATAPVAATESFELQAELARFAHIAREQRALTRTGSPMTLAQQENWARLLDTIDHFLERSARATASTDVIRARVAAEAELDMDARAYGDIPPDLAERVLHEVTRLAVRMAEVRRAGVAPTRMKLTFDWPIEPVVVTSLFGRRLHPITHAWKSHFGVDLDAYNGQLVMAAGKGTVISAGWSGAHGRSVELQHPGGVITRYSHLSAILVEPGTSVDRGDPVGLAGSTGLSTGSHLHFEFWRDGRPRDPLEELAHEPTREVHAQNVPRS